MKIKLILSVVLGGAFVFSACGSSDNKNSNNSGNNGAANSSPATDPSKSSTDKSSTESTGIIGTWALAPQEDKGITFTVSMAVGDRLVTMVNKCQAGNEMVAVSVSSRAEITSNKIRILDDNEAEEKIRDLTCSISIQKANLTYRIEGSTLLVDFPGQGPIKLTRVK